MGELAPSALSVALYVAEYTATRPGVKRLLILASKVLMARETTDLAVQAVDSLRFICVCVCA